jgi:hypothetical protein
LLHPVMTAFTRDPLDICLAYFTFASFIMTIMSIFLKVYSDMLPV